MADFEDDFEDFDAEMGKLRNIADASRARARPECVSATSLADALGNEDWQAIVKLIDERERTPAFRLRERRRAEDAAREESEWAENTVASALRGGFGKACQTIAEEITQNGHRTDLPTVRKLQRQLQKLRATEHSVPTLRMAR